MVTIIVELTDTEALAYAQHLKRISRSDCRKLAVSDNEAYFAMDAINKVQKALADIGFNPR